jgi:hypothetical protein
MGVIYCHFLLEMMVNLEEGRTFPVSDYGFSASLYTAENTVDIIELLN